MEAWLEKWARLMSRWSLLIILAWIVLVIVAFKFAPSLDSVAAKQHIPVLPATAQSVQADTLYSSKFAAGQRTQNTETDLIILTDPHGIDASDISLAQQVISWLNDPTTRPAHLTNVQGPSPQIPATAFQSSDGKALRIILTWDTADSTALSHSLDAVNAYLTRQSVTAGGTLGLFGSSSISHELYSNALSGTSGGGVLIGILIILVILGAVYRSPLAILLPLFTIALAVGLSIPVLGWLGELFGLPVASFTLQYVIFVLLGAGTNYAVFMLSRYREEIRRGDSFDRAGRQAALARAFGRVAEAIMSSAATVVVATAIMGLAQLNVLRLTGPAVAVGVCCLLLAGLTLLPALMSLFGRALFWPATPRPATLKTEEAVTKGIWAFAGRLATEHPFAVTLVTIIVLLPLAISVITIEPSFDTLKILPDNAPSVKAFAVYQQHFPDVAQAQVIINNPGGDLRTPAYSSAISQIADALGRVAHVSRVQVPAADQLSASAQSFSTDGSALVLTLSLNVDASSQEARQTVDAIIVTANRAKQGTALNGAQVLVRGESASVHDQEMQLGNDFWLVISLVCLAIYIILALLVRSLTAPIYLLGTIALSSATALGATNLIFHDLLGKPLYYIIPLMAFVFLVALGEDFNILTITRIREEVLLLGHRKGIASAVALTGGVISSCGLVMAASFSRAIMSPIFLLSELGFAVVCGVLIDTFIVRPLLVPALAMLLGRWNWIWFGKGPNSGIDTPEKRSDTEKLDSISTIG